MGKIDNNKSKYILVSFFGKGFWKNSAPNFCTLNLTILKLIFSIDFHKSISFITKIAFFTFFAVKYEAIQVNLEMKMKMFP